MVKNHTGDEVYERKLSHLFRDVRALAVCNVRYFKGAPGASNERFYNSFDQLLNHLDHGLVRGVNVLLRVAPMFDFDDMHPGNGYRSMVTLVQKCCQRLLTLSRYVTVNRESYLFRPNHYSKELEAYVTMLGQLRACLYYLQRLIEYCKNGELFPDEDALAPEEYRVAERLLQEVEYLSQESFYGRCLGFQFCESMVRSLTTINIAMACYSEGYVKTKSSLLRFANSLLSCGKYLMNPELRAKQVVNMTRTNDIHFCKSFWSLPENSVMHNAPLYMCPTMAVSKVIRIEPYPFELPVADGSGNMTILPPSAHTGVDCVMARLISSEYRSGQEFWYNSYGLRLPTSTSPIEKSSGLIIHCHGGGFVAQSSASHQMYLSFWAKELGIPILSVDYSLAPESYFPRQNEELFFAYCWALKNSHLLGATAEKICIVGDSAGANFAVSLAMRVAACGLRQPTAVVSVYGALVVKYAPSASRILALMDPLLPLGVVALCLRAYTGDGRETAESPDNETVVNVPSQTDNMISQHQVIQSLRKEADDQQDARMTTGQYSVSQPTQDSVNFLPPVMPGIQLRHHRSDSGFFDTGEQPDSFSLMSSRNSSECSRNMMCTSRDASLQNLDSASKFESAVFTLKDSSDEDSDTLQCVMGSSSSSDEQPGRSFMIEEMESSASSSTDNTSHHLCQKASCPLLARGHPGRHSNIFPPVDSNSPLISDYAQLCCFEQSPMESSRGIKVANDPYVSPAMAPNDLLKKLCPVTVLACHLDPLLDDSIMFARRLRSLGNSVNLELIEGVPHGFLNFVLVSPEAKAASGRCVQAIRKMLKLGEE